MVHLILSAYNFFQKYKKSIYPIIAFFVPIADVILEFIYDYTQVVFNYYNKFFLYTFFFLFIYQILIIIFSSYNINYLGYRGVFFVHFMSWFIFWIFLVKIYFYINLNNYFFYINLGDWFKLNFYNSINFELLIDSLSINYTLLTLTIALSVIGYTFAYFRYEPLVDRLIIFISFFVISMILLVNAGNFFVLFLGWELIGVTSFLLINFWNTRVATLKSAFKAFTFNKVSDLSLFLAILLFYNEFLTTNFLILKCESSTLSLTYFSLWNMKISSLELISFFILIATFIKSAQIGFHLWLPDSMEAPVPASALIHSATLVSAGIFILLRLNFLFELSLLSYWLIQFFGAVTAFYGGICAIYQSDVKKLLAYSTISHCGFLMVCVSLECFEITIIYLYIHGFFKATSFLCIGNVIRVALNYQDFRKMGMLFKYLPFEYYILCICLLNLSGVPFTIGFYSKHLLFAGFHSLSIWFWFIFLNCFFGALAGFIYCFRLVYNIFFDFKKGPQNMYAHLNKSSSNSIYYSNSNLVSTVSILILFLNCYLVCSLLIFSFFNHNELIKTFSEFVFVDIYYYAIFFKNLGILYNYKIFNVVFFFIIYFSVSFKYKFTTNFPLFIYSMLFYYFIFLFFYYFIFLFFIY